MELKWIITNDFGDSPEERTCSLDVQLEGWNYSAYIKRDGCVDLVKKDSCVGPNGTEDEDIHICDIPQFIEILQSLENFRMNNIDGAE